jgi:hypothetical protein
VRGARRNSGGDALSGKSQDTATEEAMESCSVHGALSCKGKYIAADAAAATSSREQPEQPRAARLCRATASDKKSH